MMGGRLLLQLVRPCRLEGASAAGISWQQIAQYVTDSSTSHLSASAYPDYVSSTALSGGLGQSRSYAKSHRRNGDPSFDPRMLPADQARLERLHWPVSPPLVPKYLPWSHFP